MSLTKNHLSEQQPEGYDQFQQQFNDWLLGQEEVDANKLSLSFSSPDSYATNTDTAAITTF